MPSRILQSNCTGPIDEDLVCAICHEVLDEPLSTPCEHLFCGDCIIEWLNARGPHAPPPECPACRQPVEGGADALQPLVRPLLNMLRAKRFHCSNKDRGCPETVPYGQVVSHEERCAFRQVTCPNEGCGLAMLAGELPVHEQQCNFTPLDCACCGQRVVATQARMAPMCAEGCGDRTIARLAGLSNEVERLKKRLHAAQCASLESFLCTHPHTAMCVPGEHGRLMAGGGEALGSQWFDASQECHAVCWGLRVEAAPEDNLLVGIATSEDRPLATATGFFARRAGVVVVHGANAEHGGYLEPFAGWEGSEESAHGSVVDLVLTRDFANDQLTLQWNEQDGAAIPIPEAVGGERCFLFVKIYPYSAGGEWQSSSTVRIQWCRVLHDE